jgi:hypothetical protein
VSAASRFMAAHYRATDPQFYARLGWDALAHDFAKFVPSVKTDSGFHVRAYPGFRLRSTLGYHVPSREAGLASLRSVPK